MPVCPLPRTALRVCFSLLATLGAVAPSQAQAPAAAPLAASAAVRPPTQAFFEHANFGGAKLSPSGKYLLAKSSAPDRHDFLVVIDLATNKPTVVASYNDADVGNFRWVNDERVVYDVADKTIAQGDVQYAPGLYAVNRDGSLAMQLVDRRGRVASRAESMGRTLLPWSTFMLDQEGNQDSEFIYVQTLKWNTKGEVRSANLLRLNTLSGLSTTVARPGDVRAWWLDQRGEPRLAMSSTEDMVTLHYLDPATQAWRVLHTAKAYGEQVQDITPIGFGEDGSLYVEARHQSDTSSMYKLDLASGKIVPTPLIVTTGYDFDGKLVRNRKKVLGAQITTDARADEWFDPGMKTIQATVDKALAATVNLLHVPADPEAPWMLVESYSDVVPTMYSLFNVKTGAVSPIASTHAAIDPRQMGPQKAVVYTARDGLRIPALLTLPRAGTRKNLPLVVLVHGGPWVRGASWGWQRESQFLASRGYAVLEPSFRGTLGLGWNHYHASWKQWGLAMQDDVADGTRWAIAQGYADPKRVCIAGASYGGYATLMGLARDPDLYKCGVNWVGVTDINLMYTGDWSASSDMSDEWKRYGMPVMIGDQVKDAAQLRATSPIALAARVKQPLILAYGGVDMRVPLYHGRKFHDAVKAHNANVEWIEYPEEGHGWTTTKNNVDFWNRVEKFLDKNIGAAQ